MSQFFHVHPANPQARLIRQAADIILQGGVVAYPTDSAYALGCRLGNKEGLDLLAALGEPMMSVTLMLPDDNLPLTDPERIRDLLGKQLDLIIDGGACTVEPTTVLSLLNGEVELMREGLGDPEPFGISRSVQHED